LKKIQKLRWNSFDDYKDENPQVFEPIEIIDLRPRAESLLLPKDLKKFFKYVQYKEYYEFIEEQEKKNKALHK